MLLLRAAGCAAASNRCLATTPQPPACRSRTQYRPGNTVQGPAGRPPTAERRQRRRLPRLMAPLLLTTNKCCAAAAC